jgi:hypothetical protein
MTSIAVCQTPRPKGGSFSTISIPFFASLGEKVSSFFLREKIIRVRIVIGKAQIKKKETRELPPWPATFVLSPF